MRAELLTLVHDAPIPIQNSPATELNASFSRVVGSQRLRSLLCEDTDCEGNDRKQSETHFYGKKRVACVREKGRRNFERGRVVGKVEDEKTVKDLFSNDLKKKVERERRNFGVGKGKVSTN